MVGTALVPHGVKGFAMSFDGLTFAGAGVTGAAWRPAAARHEGDRGGGGTQAAEADVAADGIEPVATEAALRRPRRRTWLRTRLSRRRRRRRDVRRRGRRGCRRE